MPKVTVSVQTAGGQTIVLTEGDRIVKEVTIECNSLRCASRHGQSGPSEVSLIDGQPMPEKGRQWLSLILPETSPQYTPMPPNFCGPQCVKDFLSYQYIAPSSAGVQKVDCVPVENLTPEQLAGLNSTALSQPPVQKTDLPEPTPEQLAGFAAAKDRVARLEATTDLHNLPEITEVEAQVGAHSLPEPIVIGQADGAGE